MIANSRLVKAAVLGSTAAAICSLLPPAATAVAAQTTAGTKAVAQVPAVPAPSSGVLAGTVRAFGGPGLAGICVTAVLARGDDPPDPPGGPTDSVQGLSRTGGRFLLTGLRPGDYRVGFRDCGQSMRYAAQWYGGGLTAGAVRSVLVVPGHPTFLTPVTLRPVNGTAFVAASARAMRSRLAADGRAAGSGKGPQLSGTVTSTAGKPLGGICVTAVQVGNLTELDGFGTGTGKNGTYQFPPGLFHNGTSWKVNFSVGCGSQGNFAPQWWKAAATKNDGKILRFRKNLHFANVDARLGQGASISGLVRAGSKSGPPLPSVCVIATGLGGMSPIDLVAKTGPKGKYLLTGLGTGRYNVQFTPQCGSKGDFSSGKSVTVSVTDGKVTKGVDSFLPRAGEFGGIVTTGAGHRPLPGICVETQGVFGHDGLDTDTRTGPDGRYTFTDLPAGHYKVGFFAGCGNKGSFGPQFYKGQESVAAADSILLRAGAHVSGIDAVMAPGGIVTGTATDSAGKKLTGVCVVLTNQADQGQVRIISITISVSGSGGATAAQAGAGSGSLSFGGYGITDAEGRYRVSDLTPGNYSVTYSSGCKRHQPTEGTAWFSPQGNGAMSLVTVGQGTTSGVDAKLPAPGTVTGVITGPSGRPLAGVCAVPVGLGGEPDNSLAELVNFSNTPESNRHGVYRITGLAAGKYGIQFLPCTTTRPLADEWYRHSASFAGLTPVVVKSGHVTAGINGQLVTGQSISGRITKAGTGQPISETACVFVVDSSGNLAGLGESRKDGTYRVPNLVAGRYNLRVGPCAGSALASVLRTHVKVGSSKPTTGVDIALPVPGVVIGQVTGGSPARAVGGSCVFATPKTGHGAPLTTYSASDGRYEFGGLAPGKYRVEFSTLCLDSTGGFASQWFDHKSTSAKANLVSVPSDSVVVGIDARLAADGEISGSVQVSGSAKAGVCALALPKAGVGSKTPTVGTTDAQGRYLIGGLAPGRYVVEFTAGCGVASYHTQWFDGASSRKSATPVAVKAGSVTTGIDAH
ncbi:MAG TPA: hypothetical protein VFI65_07905 [Streptosporangiaceae bacterium]|nr:hypothetical protein [Streptosporangiaceae bacterium]